MSWWIVRADRTLTADIAADPAMVRDVYTDLDNIADLHPLVVSVRRTSHTESVRTYRIKDRIPLGPINLAITYRARVEVSGSGVVTAQARQFPGVRLDSVVSFDRSAGGTHVAEQLRITAPRPLAAVTVSQAVAAHAETWAGIRRRFGD